MTAMWEKSLDGSNNPICFECGSLSMKKGALYVCPNCGNICKEKKDPGGCYPTLDEAPRFQNEHISSPWDESMDPSS